MSDFGMQMPAARAKRSGGMNVYTALLFVAAAALLAACVVVYTSAVKVGPAGNAFAVQDAKRIELPKN